MSSVCTMQYPSGGCVHNYTWVAGPSLFERLTSSKYNPGIPTTEQVCGGFVGETGQFACPKGYYCQYPKPVYPDAQGVCIKE